MQSLLHVISNNAKTLETLSLVFPIKYSINWIEIFYEGLPLLKKLSYISLGLIDDKD